MLERIRRTIPGVSLRSSFIVGFPGETDADFKILCDFVREAEFDWLGVFSYSDEDAARSYALDGKVDAETIAERRAELMGLQKKISRRKLRARVGETVRAMLEGPSKENELIWTARLQGMAPDIDGTIYITDIAGINEAELLPPPGTFGTVEIEDAQDYDLIGRVVSLEQAAVRSMSCAATSSNLQPATGLISISPALS